MEAKKIFLEKSLLGRNTFKSNMVNEDKLIKECINKSVGDMFSGGRFYLKSGEKERIIDETKKLICDNKFKFDREIILKEAKIIIQDTENPSEEKTRTFLTKDGKKEIVKTVTGFGLAQKVINMSFKHFYVFNEYLKDLNIDYSQCDCPLDRNVLNPKENKKENNPLLFDKIQAKGYAWTRLTEQQYEDIQSQIDNLMSNDEDIRNELSKLTFDKDIGRMKYDFIVW